VGLTPPPPQRHGKSNVNADLLVLYRSYSMGFK